MAVVDTGTSALVSGGFGGVYWKGENGTTAPTNPWVSSYNLGRAMTGVHEFKCGKGGCHWTRLDWNLKTGRANHVAFILDGRKYPCIL